MENVLKKLATLCPVLFLIFNTASAQLENPVHWDFTVKKIDSRTFEIRASAEIDPQWHIYSQHTNQDLGLPTTFNFKKNPLIEIVGAPKEEGKLVEQTEGMAKIRFYQEKVDFVQTVKIKQGVRANLNLIGNVDFMACSDINGMCLPQDNTSFEIKLQ